ncbi:FtsK/SpoIIIE domain-containing protein [Streptomyces sp. NPDC048639]|uniref:FtsK/SpoIIIE domain-containing protein n=1 Tax=Streptomyces sp. NPDC048639 TaxID=3365581 RepID=UPI0037123097
MQIRLTVLGPRGGHAARACDVLVTAPVGTALAAVASGLAAAVAAASGASAGAGSASAGPSSSGPGAASGSPGGDPGSGGSGGSTGPVVLYAGGERLDPQRCALGEPPLTDGAVLSLNSPADPGRHPGVPQEAPSDASAQLHVVSGPDAGGVHLLHSGRIRIGRSAEADVPLDDPDVSRLHCAVTVADDGQVTIADLGSTNGTSLDGAPLGTGPLPFHPGSLLRLGESALRLVGAEEPLPGAAPSGAAAGAGARSGGSRTPLHDVLPTAPDGEGHLRVALPARPATRNTGAAAGTPASADPAASTGPMAPMAPVGSPASTGPAGAAAGGLGAIVAGDDPPVGPGPYDAGPAANGWGPGAPAGPAGAPGTGHGGSGAPRRPSWATGPYDDEDCSVPSPAPARQPDDEYDGRPRTPGSVPPPRTAGVCDANPDDRSAFRLPHQAPAPEGQFPGPFPGAGSGAVTHGAGHRTRHPSSPAPVSEVRETGGVPGAQEPGDPEDDMPRRPTRWGRGIGAWARRFAAGRDAEAPDGPAAGHRSAAPQPSPDAARAAATAFERWPDPADILLTALGPGPRLWERGPGHPDGLVVRLGTTDRSDAPATPVTVALREAGSLGLAGPRPRLAGLTRAIVAQLAALHAPPGSGGGADGLEIVLISTDRSRSAADRLAEWSWLGWLPHARPAHGQDCRLLLAHDRDQATARTDELVRRLDDGPLGPGWVTADRAAVAAAAQRYDGPHTLVIVDGDPGSSALRGTAARLAAGGAAAGVHLLCLAEAPAATPASPLAATFGAACTASPPFSECGAAGLLSGDVATALRVVPLSPSGPVGMGVVANVDAVSAAWAERFARALAPLRAAGVPGAGSAAGSRRIATPLPRTARLLDELGLARATPASLTARWAAAADSDGSAGGAASAVLGAGQHGPLSVDLTLEGPHLLLEGGRGTGKTELLRSLAASLAAADRPDRLSLALVDGGGTERGEGLRICTDLPHVSTYLAAADPVRMREFAQALSTELKRRAELLGELDFTEWHRRRAVAGRLVAPRRSAERSTGPYGEQGPQGERGTSGEQSPYGERGPHSDSSCAERGDQQAAERRGDLGDVESTRSGTLKLRAAGPTPEDTRAQEDRLPRLVVLVDDFDELVDPALGSRGRPSAGSVVRALESVARDGARLGVHLIAAVGRPDRTAETAAAARAGLRVTLDLLPARAEGPDAGEASAGRGRLVRSDGSQAAFQAGRVTGRIPRTATQRPTVVALDWERMGDPPARRPLRELGNGPTDLALLASALQRAAEQSAPPSTPLRLL